MALERKKMLFEFSVRKSESISVIKNARKCIQTPSKAMILTLAVSVADE